MEDVVFKEGVLYLQGLKFGKKTWRRIWALLFQPSKSGVGRVELYTIRDGSTFLQVKSPLFRRAERRVIRLCDCLSVTTSQEEVCPPDCSAFLLKTTQRCYTLASDTCQDWVDSLLQMASQTPVSLNPRSRREEKEPTDQETKVLPAVEEILMENNELYSTWKTAQYDITIQPTEASRRCNLAGDYFLCPDTDGLLLVEPHTAQIIYSWPYHLLRRFGFFKGGFSIEAGRRCSSGEGQFCFLSQQGPRIHLAVEAAIAQHHQEDTKPAPWTSLPPSEALTLGCYIDSRHVQSDSPDRLASTQQPPRSSPTGCFFPVEERDEGDGELYATIDDWNEESCKHPVPRRMQSLPEASLGSERDEEDSDRCFSLEAIRLEDFNGESDYYNLREFVQDQGVQEKDNSGMECTYAVVSSPQSQSQSQIHFQGQPLSQPQPNYYQPKSYPQFELQAPVGPKLKPTHPKPQLKAQSQPRHQSPVQVEEEAEERGERRARHVSPPINPTEIPVSFKQKLSDILSKDLAKFQPAQSSGERDSPTFYH